MVGQAWMSNSVDVPWLVCCGGLTLVNIRKRERPLPGSRNCMQRRSKGTVAAGMPIARLLSRSHLEIALGYLAGYVLLDWLSYVHPFAPFGITPWNPSTGLS